MSAESGVTRAILLERGEGDGRLLPPRAIPGEQRDPAALEPWLERTLGLPLALLHDGGLAYHDGDAPIRIEPRGPLPAALEGDARPTTATSLPNARRWQLPGWRARVEAWVEARLAAHGERVRGRAKLVSSSDLACVLRFDTDAGSAYLKAEPAPRESVRMECIARAHPTLVPEVIAVDALGDDLLSRDAGRRLSDVAGRARWRRALERLAAFHHGDAASALRAVGVETHDALAAPERLTLLLRDGDELPGWGITPERSAALTAALPRVQRARDRIAALEIAVAPCHGDAQPMNALDGTGGMRWFDWSEACIAHPFTDAGWFLAWLTPAARRAHLPLLRDATDDRAVEAVLDDLWRAYLVELGRPDARPLRRDATLLALAHRIAVYHERFADFEGTLPGWRPRFVPYYAGRLERLAERYRE